ncbi:MAG: hypothetical protein SFZ03_08520 [Candidatus Melainabacteria bacterium]|nr:hypothetical protein [Candidatus Melainabacteria bacterium]
MPGRIEGQSFFSTSSSVTRTVNGGPPVTETTLEEGVFRNDNGNITSAVRRQSNDDPAVVEVLQGNPQTADALFGQLSDTDVGGNDSIFGQLLEGANPDDSDTDVGVSQNEGEDDLITSTNNTTGDDVGNNGVLSVLRGLIEGMDNRSTLTQDSTQDSTDDTQEDGNTTINTTVNSSETTTDDDGIDDDDSLETDTENSGPLSALSVVNNGGFNNPMADAIRALYGNIRGTLDAGVPSDPVAFQGLTQDIIGSIRGLMGTQGLELGNEDSSLGLSGQMLDPFQRLLASTEAS